MRSLINCLRNSNCWKYQLLFLCLVLAINSFAQERLFTDKEHGGAENGVFGKIQDEINVSPADQLSYEIPIPALPGTGGIKPSLSVTYNSSTKNGFAGYGFDLSGLSIISRIPSDRFHDNKCTAIDFSDNDHFSLDGQRLMVCKGSYGDEIEYRTENNSFAKIVANGKKTNPTSFKVYTKSGLTYDYMSVAEALGETHSDSTLFWLVTRISDTKGNYMTVTYGGDASTNDYYPSRVDYTGNATQGLIPYASVRFGYTINPYTPVTYINGARVKRSRIITSIGLYMGNQLERSFILSYQTVNRRYQLSKVMERTFDGKYKNPTRFTWSNLADFNVKKYNYTQTKLIHKANLTVGDFNGDGMADFIATPENEDAGWKGWKIFISHGTYFEQVANGTWYSDDDDIEQVVCGDFNGDGYTDVVVKRCHSGKWHNCDLYTTSVDNNGKVSLGFSKCFLSLSINYTIQAVELNGDGATDLFAWLENSKECKLIRSEQNGNTLTPLGYTATRYCSEKWDRVEFGDFNGDGLTDVMNLNDNGHYIMYSDGWGTMTNETKSSWPDKNHNMELGDFNGDGKTDMLLTGWSKDPNSGGWTDWCINYSKGDGTFICNYYPKPFDARSKQLFVADLNGDGFDDLQAIDRTSSGSDMTQPQVFLNDGRGNFYQQVKGGSVYATDKWHFYAGDFNGDGKADFVCTSDWNNSNWDGFQLYLMPTDTHSLLTGIKDGLGNQTSIDYKYLTNDTVFTRGKTKSYPLISIGSSWPVVSSVSTPDGIGGINVVSYKYEDALFHNNGRGLLGFRKCYIKDETTGMLNSTEYAVNTEKYVITPIHSQTEINGIKVEEYDYTYILNTDYTSNTYTYLPATIHQRNYEFNTGDVVKDVTTSYEYDNFGNTTNTTVKDGSVTTTTINTFTNDAENWILGRLTASTVSKSNENGTITKSSTFEYDASSGLLTAETFAPESSKLGYRKTYVHDCYGNIIKSAISPLDNSSERVTQSTYDARGRFIVSSTNSLGFTESHIVAEASGLITASTDMNGIVTDYTYDEFGNLVETVTPISKALKTTGWSAGMEDAPSTALFFDWEKTTGAPYTITFYDQLGRTVRTVQESIGGKKIYTDIEYDKKGQITQTSEPYFSGCTVFWNKNEYDVAGRTIKQTDAEGNSFTFEYDGLTITTTDPLCHITTMNNNFCGLLVKSIDNDGSTVAYKYNADGKCIEITGPRTTIYSEYDLAGNRISLDDPDLGQSEDTYNAYGELVQHKDGHGATNYEYDDGGRIVLEERPDMTIESQYDKQWKGALDCTQIINQQGVSKVYEYDQYGRIVKEADNIERLSYTTYTSYDAEGHVSTITYPSGQKIKNSYDACGILVAVGDAKSGNEYWRLLGLDARGQVEEEQYGNGLVTSTTHDARKGTVSYIYTPGVQNWTYDYDAVGNLVKRRDIGRNLTESFCYDGLNRLLEVKQNGKVIQSISYDASGNIVEKSDVGSYTYAEGSNRLTSITDCVRSPLTWNEIEYNSFDKVTYASSDNKSISITYGPDKERAKLIIEGIKKYYPNLYFEESITNRTVHNTSYVFAFGKTVAIITDSPSDALSPHIMYVHHDQLGSVQAYSDENGQLYQELSYDAWGARRNPDTWENYTYHSEAKAWKERGFGGHEHIDVLDMINMNGRMYDPVVGRFISADPFIQSPDFTQSLNRYAYCINNPLSLIDPSGYSWFSRNWKSLSATVVGIAVSVVTMGSATSLGACIAASAAGGAAGALTGSLLNGANIGQIAKATFTGAFWGGLAGAANNLAGNINEFWLRIGAHTLSEGAMEGLQGGNMLHGFMMGATSSLGGSFIDHNLESLGKVGEVAANSILSGTVDEIGGGKFANGAITGAFSVLFNDIMHSKKQKQSWAIKQIRKIILSDGMLTLDESWLWYKIGDGKPLTVDAAKLDLDYIDVSTLSIGQKFTTSTWKGNLRQGLVYGSVNCKYLGKSNVKISSDTYDFDHHYNATILSEKFRNWETVIADKIHGKGNPFKINFRGINHISDSLASWIKRKIF